jgi:outer membrane protein OmpA-like peptidoglycan-associated protein
MKTIRLAESARLVVSAGTLILAISSCGLVPISKLPAMRDLLLSPGRTSLLVVITDQDSEPTLKITKALVIASARAGERVIVLGDRGGVLLTSSAAPRPPIVRVPSPPAPLPPGATSFQKSHYANATHDYQNMMSRARATLQRRQREQLAAWARTVTTWNVRRLQRHPGNDSINTALGAATADVASLLQTGENYAAKVITIIGTDPISARSAPSLPSGLRGSTIVVNNFPGNDDEEAAWQADLLHDGATRVVLLTSATDDQLGFIVRQGLDGATTDTLTSVLFALGQYKLRPDAVHQLWHLLHLLTTDYPDATASINGYTDDLPTPGGNLKLSRRRAQTIEDWLIAHGVAASRLQAAGYGDTNPIAPNTPEGQPLNRRVAVVIDPTAPA